MKAARALPRQVFVGICAVGILFLYAPEKAMETISNCNNEAHGVIDPDDKPPESNEDIAGCGDSFAEIAD